MKNALKIFFGIVVVFLILLGAYIFWALKNEDENWGKNPLARISFSLQDDKSTYKIIKTEHGFYMIEYTKGRGYSPGSDPNIDDTRTEYIGSSKVDLEKFIDKSVMVTGQYRTTFGTPLCWKDGCLQYTTYGENKETVVDIENLVVK